MLSLGSLEKKGVFIKNERKYPDKRSCLTTPMQGIKKEDFFGGHRLWIYSYGREQGVFKKGSVVESIGDRKGPPANILAATLSE